VAIAEISIPGVRATRSIEAPTVTLPGGADPSAVVLAKAEPQPSGCVQTPLSWVCSPALATSTEEQYGFDESFAETRARSASLSGSAVLTDPTLIQRYAFSGAQQAVVTASSTATADPEDQAYAAFDGNRRTSWVSGATDHAPWLTIRWRGQRTLDSIRVVRPAGVTGPQPMLISGAEGTARSVILGAPGAPGPDSVSFAPMTTTSLTLSFPASSAPVQIADVQIPGLPQLISGPPGTQLRLGCGHGPAIEFDGATVPTQATGTVRHCTRSRVYEHSGARKVRSRSEDHADETVERRAVRI
jgi:arabinofuranan 3-O-arabinosyltransferase